MRERRTTIIPQNGAVVDGLGRVSDMKRPFAILARRLIESIAAQLFLANPR